MKLPSLNHLHQTYQRIQDHIRLTPITTSKSLNTLLGVNCYFKCENTQVTNSFKIRGATNAVMQYSKITNHNNKSNFATHSSGNHAIALSQVGKTLNLTTYIVVPENAPLTKLTKIQQNNAVIRFCTPTTEARIATLEQIVKEFKAIYIPSANQLDIIMGQASCAFEIFQLQQSSVDTIIAPVGGGGLLAGTCLATRTIAPKCTIIGAEPALANDCAMSLQQKKLITAPYSNTIADGLRVPIAETPWSIIRAQVNDVLVCSEDTIAKAMQLIKQHLNMIVEPSAATPLAVILENLTKFRAHDVMLILTGGKIFPK